MSDRGDRDWFVEHGWLVVRGLVPRERVAALEAALDAVLPAVSYPAWAGQVVEIAGISRASELLARHAHDEAIAGIAGDLLGAARIQLLQDTALVKPAGNPATIAWHQDFSYLAYLDAPRVVTARLALSACTEANGCMRVIDGSHTWGLHGDDRTFRSASVEDTLDALAPELRARATAAERLVELEPGDVSFHSCLTFHGSRDNQTSDPRKTLVVRLMDAACRLVPERLPSPELAAIFTADADGHLVGPSFPVLWDRARAAG